MQTPYKGSSTVIWLVQEWYRKLLKDYIEMYLTNQVSAFEIIFLLLLLLLLPFD